MDQIPHDEVLSLQRQQFPCAEELPFSQFKLTQRANIDTTPGSDQVRVSRPRNLLESNNMSSVPSPSVQQFTVLGERNVVSLQTDPNQFSIHTRQHGTIALEYSQHCVSLLDIDDDFKGSCTDIPADAETRADSEDTIAEKFCGVRFPTTALRVADMAECCDGIGIRDKLNSFLGAKSVKIFPTLSGDDDDTHDDNTTHESCADYHWESCNVSRNFVESNQMAEKNDTWPPYLPVDHGSELEQQDSIAAEDAHRTALAKHSRRLRLARSHKQRLQAKQ